MRRTPNAKKEAFDYKHAASRGGQHWCRDPIIDMPISLVPPDTSHGIRLGGVRQAFMWQQAPPARLTKQRGPWKLGKVAQLKEITARRGLHTKADRGSEAKKAVAFFVIPGSGKDALKVKKMMGGT